MNLGRPIRRRRVALGKTQDQMERDTRLDQGYLSRVETGAVKRPNGMHLVLIASALGCTAEDLVREARDADPVRRQPALTSCAA